MIQNKCCIHVSRSSDIDKQGQNAVVNMEAQHVGEAAKESQNAVERDLW